ncbi:hypothetical protein F4805DRAFT_414352 [Annulohypoxylon moriforme]|nr:hypothetical protein F4805DRAFT_414352 [Annulohypoxylon moriforme]
MSTRCELLSPAHHTRSRSEDINRDHTLSQTAEFGNPTASLINHAGAHRCNLQLDSAEVSRQDAHQLLGIGAHLAAVQGPTHGQQGALEEDISLESYLVEELPEHDFISRFDRDIASNLRESRPTNAAPDLISNPNEITTHQPHNSSIRGGISNLIARIYLRKAIVPPLMRLCSILDMRTTVRFIVVIFSHLMGVATTISVKIAPSRPGDALSSVDDDGYPIMVAQVAASMLSPLLFGIVSTRESSTPLRQKMTSFYYLLLVLGVLMSLMSLLLYSSWPSGYRVTNLTLMASLMFSVLGGWQFLEKCWRDAACSEGEDIELGLRRD